MTIDCGKLWELTFLIQTYCNHGDLHLQSLNSNKHGGAFKLFLVMELHSFILHPVPQNSTFYKILLNWFPKCRIHYKRVCNIQSSNSSLPETEHYSSFMFGHKQQPSGFASEDINVLLQIASTSNNETKC